MKKFTIHFAICLFLFTNQIKAQVWTTYDTLDGLADYYVHAIAIDAEGNKWFGTSQGVSKFDGNNWTTYTTADGLISNDVNAIAIDAKGNKWFGGVYHIGGSLVVEGISKFDGTTWTTNYNDTTDGNRCDEIINNSVHAIAIDQSDNIWISMIGLWCTCAIFQCWETGNRVLKFDGLNWTPYKEADGLASNWVNAIAIDAEGNKWFGTTEGVSKFDDTTWTTYDTLDGLADYYVHAIAIDAEGNKWFGTTEGVSKFDDTTWTTYETLDGLASNDVRSIAIDAEGNKWFGTNRYWDYVEQDWVGGGGVSKFDGTNWTTYDTLDGLASNDVTAIAIDAEGNKWFGTEGGVSKLDERIIPYISTSPDNQNIGFEAGNTVFSVSSNSSWTLSDDAEWLVINPIRGSGDGTITASYSTNTFASSRVATIITTGSGKSDTVTVTQDGFVSVSSLYNSKVTVYPNPAKDITIFKLENNNNRKVYLEIFDLSGRLIGEKTSTDERIEFDFSNYSSGIYFYKLRNSEKIIGAGKIVRE